MLVLENATLCDLERNELVPDRHVTIEGDLIVEVSDRPVASSTAERIDLKGRCLLPGLIDAHFHAVLVDLDSSRMRDMPVTLMTARASRRLETALMRGFTTVRDMAGADWGLRQAVAEGSLVGPRLFIAGRGLSQSGGHGDFRRRTDGDIPCHCSSALAMNAVIADGKEGVQRAAREQLRQGVDHLKVAVSGGVSSPHDPLESAQYTDEELAAIVHEAHAWGLYVAAHAYTAASILRSARAGIRTIEHGNLIDQEAAEALAAREGFLVPTLITYEALHREGASLGLPPSGLEKLARVLEAGLGSVEIALRAGVRVGFGTDLIGGMHVHQSEELLLRARVQKPHEVLAAATSVNADILRMNGRLGVIRAGAFADLIAVNGNPMRDLNLLQDQGKHLDLIMKGGRMFKLHV